MHISTIMLYCQQYGGLVQKSVIVDVLMWLAAVLCAVSASCTVDLKPIDAGYKFLGPFVAVLVICMCVMLTIMVSLHFAACAHY